MNVLVVDDNSDYLFLLDLALSLGGYTVFTAEDGLEGIEILESKDIDLIISDIRMPQLDGIKLHAYVRNTEKYCKTKFIFVTGFKDIYANVVVLDTALDFFLEKTTSTEDLLKLVNRLLNRDFAGQSLEAL